MEIVPNKALSQALSLSLSLYRDREGPKTVTAFGAVSFSRPGY